MLYNYCYMFVCIYLAQLILVLQQVGLIIFNQTINPWKIRLVAKTPLWAMTCDWRTVECSKQSIFIVEIGCGEIFFFPTKSIKSHKLIIFTSICTTKRLWRGTWPVETNCRLLLLLLKLRLLLFIITTLFLPQSLHHGMSGVNGNWVFYPNAESSSRNCLLGLRELRQGTNGATVGAHFPLPCEHKTNLVFCKFMYQQYLVLNSIGWNLSSKISCEWPQASACGQNPFLNSKQGTQLYLCLSKSLLPSFPSCRKGHGFFG